MSEKEKTALAIMALSLFAATSVFAGLGDLMRLGKDQAEVQKSYDRETASYEAVKTAVEKDRIRKGQSKDQIEKDYGEPVITLPERGTQREKWYYKRASASFFGGEKIILFFDKGGLLDEILIEENK